jgi:hypothetical protein
MLSARSTFCQIYIPDLQIKIILKCRWVQSRTCTLNVRVLAFPSTKKLKNNNKIQRKMLKIV